MWTGRWSNSTITKTISVPLISLATINYIGKSVEIMQNNAIKSFSLSMQRKLTNDGQKNERNWFNSKYSRAIYTESLPNCS